MNDRSHTDVRVMVWYVQHVGYSMNFGSVRFDCSTARYMLFLSILHIFLPVMSQRC
jgi:hypothetical protein